MFRFQPSVESLETRETPSGSNLASVTDLVIDSYSGYSGPGVFKTRDGGQTWTLVTDAGSGRITGLAVDPDPSAADGRKFKMLVAPVVLDLDGGANQLQGALFIAKQQAAGASVGGSDSIWIDISPPVREDGTPRFFNGIVSRISAGDTNETSTPIQPTILLQRLANPG